MRQRPNIAPNNEKSLDDEPSPRLMTSPRLIMTVQAWADLNQLSKIVGGRVVESYCHTSSNHRGSTISLVSHNRLEV
jgi:hypothetical protein